MTYTFPDCAIREAHISPNCASRLGQDGEPRSARYCDLAISAAFSSTSLSSGKALKPGDKNAEIGTLTEAKLSA